MGSIETHKRSIAKAFSYRVLGTFYTCVIVLILTNELKLTLAIGVLDSVGKIIGYFVHERLWSKIKFGLKEEKRPEYEI